MNNLNDFIGAGICFSCCLAMYILIIFSAITKSIYLYEFNFGIALFEALLLAAGVAWAYNIMWKSIL